MRNLMRTSVKQILSAALFAAVTTLGAWTASAASVAPAADPNTPVAKVNDQEITNGELRFAEAEIGSELAGVPTESRRRVLVEYLIEAHLMAQAAEKAQLGTSTDFESRMKYYRMRALRDAFFENKVRDDVGTDQAKAIYDEKVKAIPVQQEVRARHILVKTKDEAEKISKEIAGGADFAEAAKKYSQDSGGENGGDLGYFGRGQMVKPFEEAAFALEKGKVSAPVQSEFGWHIIKIEDKRDRQPPAFEDVKDQITASLVQAKLQSTVQQMREGAKIEILDPDVKKAIDAEADQNGGAAAQKPDEKKQ
jgi:peptidyl-prolyl cis-trans isomerase C